MKGTDASKNSIPAAHQSLIDSQRDLIHIAMTFWDNMAIRYLLTEYVIIGPGRGFPERKIPMTLQMMPEESPAPVARPSAWWGSGCPWTSCMTEFETE
jgi:hypothetical protein